MQPRQSVPSLYPSRPSFFPSFLPSLSSLSSAALLALAANTACVLVGDIPDTDFPDPNTPEDTRGKVVGSVLLESYTPETLTARLDEENPLFASTFPPEFDIDVYQLTYTTIDARGNDTTATGVLALPKGGLRALPLLSYQHGTIHEKNEAPSVKDDGERLIALVTAGSGYATTVPDYVGMGDGPGFHPYVHAASEASAVIDLLRAAKSFAVEQDADISEETFLFGYSQGGHATMAALRALQEDPQYAGLFDVTAGAPMAGPYDVSGVQAEVITRNEPYPEPSYLPYIILGYNEAYDVFDDLGEILQEPYATQMKEMFGTASGGEINDVLPVIPREMLQPSVIEDFENNPDSPLRAFLRDNDLYDWKPEFPLRMYHCQGDKHVDFRNAEVALARFTELGAPSVELKSMGEELDHNGCVLPALIDVKNYFDGFVRGE